MIFGKKNNVEKWMPQNIGELTSFLTEKWEVIPQEIVNNLVFSMKKRCESVLEKTEIKSHIEFFISNKVIDLTHQHQCPSGKIKHCWSAQSSWCDIICS